MKLISTIRNSHWFPANHRTPTVCLWALTVFFLIGALPSLAQTTYQTSASDFISLIRGQNFPVTDPVKYNAVELYAISNSLLYVDQDASLQSGGSYSIFTTMNWVSNTRVPASLLGCDELTTPVSGRTLIVQNLNLTNVDLDTGTVQLGLQPPSGNSSLSLINSSLAGQLTPWLYVPAALQFNVSGSSWVSNWSGLWSSVTTLNIASNGSLRIQDCGDTSGGASPSSMFYFNSINNTAVVDGGTLSIDDSAVIFGLNPHDINNNQSTMAFNNSATLLMVGSSYYTKLETDRVELQNSTLNMSNAFTRLTLRTHLELNDSTAFIANGAQVTTLDVVVTNDSTATLQGQGIITDFLDINSGATLTLTGPDGCDMRVSTRIYFPSTRVGTLNITDHAGLTMYSSGSGGIVTLNSHAVLTTTTYSRFSLQSAVMNLFSSGTFTNAGMFDLQAPSALNIFNDATIQGAGQVEIYGMLQFGAGAVSNQAKHTLTTNNKLWFSSAAMVNMSLDPTALSCDRLICSNQIDINNHPHLALTVTNDVPLNLGTKFILIDYPNPHGYLLGGGYNGSRFNEYTNNHTFTLGLNTYQLRYSDTSYTSDDSPSQFTTLTVVSNAVSGVLNISPQNGTNAMLSWSATSTNFVLEYADYLTPPPTWTNVSGEAVLVGTQILFSVPINAVPQRFFRLRQP